MTQNGTATDSDRYAEHLRAAQEIACIGGAKTLEYFRRPITVEAKADSSPVTIADRETEQTIRGEIAQRFPEHRVVGEEYGGELGRAEWEWIVDPIDGTKSFIRGVPLYTTLIALVHRGTPVVGVIHAPVTGETVAAAVGQGAFDETGASVSVSTCRTLTDAWYVTTDPHDFSQRHPRFSAILTASCSSMRTWADAYGYMLLARGAIDVMIDPVMSPWDIAPLSVIVREAGGVFSGIDGTIDDLGGSALAAATDELHRETVKLYRESKTL